MVLENLKISGNQKNTHFSTFQKKMPMNGTRTSPHLPLDYPKPPRVVVLLPKQLLQSPHSWRHPNRNASGDHHPLLSPPICCPNKGLKRYTMSMLCFFKALYHELQKSPETKKNLEALSSQKCRCKNHRKSLDPSKERELEQQEFGCRHPRARMLLVRKLKPPRGPSKMSILRTKITFVIPIGLLHYM